MQSRVQEVTSAGSLLFAQHRAERFLKRGDSNTSCWHCSLQHVADQATLLLNLLHIASVAFSVYCRMDGIPNQNWSALSPCGTAWRSGTGLCKPKRVIPMAKLLTPIGCQQSTAFLDPISDTSDMDPTRHEKILFLQRCIVLTACDYH